MISKQDPADENRTEEARTEAPRTGQPRTEEAAPRNGRPRPGDTTDATSGSEPPATGTAPNDLQPTADTTSDGDHSTTGTTPSGELSTADASSDEQPAAGMPSEGERPRGAKGRFIRARVAGAVAAMVVAAIAATAVLQWVAAAQADDARTKMETERALRLEVSGAASAFSKALLSYDYQKLQATRATLSAQATGDFLATYDTAFGGAMAQVIVKLKATSQATVREVYLADVDEATAHAIVVVDQQVNTSEAIRSVRDSHLKIALVKEKGIWKVHDVTVLGAASEDQYNLDGDDKKKE
ncbi:hypothetical protein [Nonomuraea basaltis]|uniref:hypothetical protein n=1 Tax=Nonomuraea basaltis TaxID=2495887 RepID=UPI00110C4EA3|nr:hypothetical protein [Nonomuraea basaltis]TMR96863.1 hypothetical protein EJK15_20685 [Nonomuraea basaltis]